MAVRKFLPGRLSNLYQIESKRGNTGIRKAFYSFFLWAETDGIARTDRSPGGEHLRGVSGSRKKEIVRIHFISFL